MVDYKKILTEKLMNEIGISKKVLEKLGDENYLIHAEADADEIPDEENNKAPKNEVHIYGPIVDDESAENLRFWGFKNFTNPGLVDEMLANCDGDITVRIDSPGGVSLAAAKIVDMLKSYDGGKVNGRIEGRAYSAASIIMLAVDKGALFAIPRSDIMIHCGWTMMVGNGDDMVDYGKHMQSRDVEMAEDYSKRGNKTKNEFLELMRKETWLTTKEAMKMGLIDGIVDYKDEKDKKKQESNNKIETSINKIDELEKRRNEALKFWHIKKL